jgi:hypothetical protein
MSTRLDGTEFRPFIAGIDVDDTMIVTGPAPEYAIIGLRLHCKEVMEKWYKQGLYLMINTCRANNQPEGFPVEKLLFENQIPYHIINDHSVWSREEWLPGISRKLYAEVYIDDKNLTVQEMGTMWTWLEIDIKVQNILRKKFDKFGIKPNDDYRYHTRPQNAQNEIVQGLCEKLGMGESECKFDIYNFIKARNMNSVHAAKILIANLECDIVQNDLFNGKYDTFSMEPEDYNDMYGHMTADLLSDLIHNEDG